MGEVADEVVKYLNEKSLQFIQLRDDRNAAGAEEYGAITFLGNDVIRMMLEELADTANYCEMQAIKLLILQERLEAEMTEHGMIEDGDAKVDIGFQSFKGTKDGWKK
jgi:hypothetical protein